MALKPSLKPIETAIRKTERELRKSRRTATPLQKRKIASTIRKLDLMIKDLRSCCGHNHTYNPVQT